MSRSKEQNIKKQHAYVAAWLDRLAPQKVRALACQHGVEKWESTEIGNLRTELLLMQSVQNVVGIPSGTQEAVQAK